MNGARVHGLRDFPELGSVWISDITSVCGPLALPVERDFFFESDSPLSRYAGEAHAAGRIQA